MMKILKSISISMVFAACTILSMEEKDTEKSLQLPKGCIFKPDVIAALCKVQRALHTQQLGLKIRHYYKPIASQIKKRPDYYTIDARSIDSQANLLPQEKPIGYYYFMDSPTGGESFCEEINNKTRKKREILACLMHKYGFVNKENYWIFYNERGSVLCRLEQDLWTF